MSVILLFRQQGTSSVNCVISATEAQDTSNIVTNALVSTLLNATEAQDSANIQCAALLQSTLNATEAQDTASLQATVSATLNATLNATESQDTSSIQVRALVSTILNATDGQDTASLNANVIVGNVLTATESQDAANMQASVSFASLNATLVATEAQDTATMQVSSAEVLVFKGGIGPSKKRKKLQQEEDERLRKALNDKNKLRETISSLFEDKKEQVSVADVKDIVDSVKPVLNDYRLNAISENVVNISQKIKIDFTKQKEYDIDLEEDDIEFLLMVA